MENEDFSALLRTATPWTLQNKAFYSIVCHIYGPFGPIRSNPAIICPKALLKIRPLWTKTGPKCLQIPYFAVSERFLKVL